MNSLGFLSALGIFVLAMVMLFGGLFFGYTIKHDTPTSVSLTRFDALLIGGDLLLLGLTCYAFSQASFFITVICTLAATFVSGIVWSRTDFSTVGAHGVRWF